MVMKKLNKIRKMELVFLAIAIILELLGVILKITALSIAALVILLSCIVVYLILFRCPYCGKFLGSRYGNAIKEKDGKHICPYCSHTLD